MRSVHEERRARFEKLVGSVGEPLRRYAARRTDPETAQDVVADALLVLWRRLDDVPAGAELPWCYAVARKCLANAERSARRQRGLVARVTRLDPPGPAVDEHAETPDPALHRALAQLRPAEQELLRLWAWEDLSPTEISLVLGVTPNAVNIRLHRARGRLADLLAADDRKPDTPTGHTPAERRPR